MCLCVALSLRRMLKKKQQVQIYETDIACRAMIQFANLLPTDKTLGQSCRNQTFLHTQKIFPVIVLNFSISLRCEIAAGWTDCVCVSLQESDGERSRDTERTKLWDAFC